MKTLNVPSEKMQQDIVQCTCLFSVSCTDLLSPASSLRGQLPPLNFWLSENCQKTFFLSGNFCLRMQNMGLN